MKYFWKTLICASIICFSACNGINENALEAQAPSHMLTPPDEDPDGNSKVKLAILLDTSGSMDGLIEQAKNQLWKIVNQLAKAKDADHADPDIEIALYHYGNDHISSTQNYVQKISGFTSELDLISEKLFSLRTNGGSEYCGAVIHDALHELDWSDNKRDLQFVFIAGNEPFTQGGVSYKMACQLARDKNVFVNTIFCGDYNEGVNTNWEHGAILGHGKYMNIDHDAQVVHIDSPYDKHITQLNDKLNDTYVPYGKEGANKKAKQVAQDNNAESYGSANVTKRVISKSSKAYKNTSWDLVDAMEEDEVNVTDIPVESLPVEMVEMNDQEKIDYVIYKKVEREKIKEEINSLNIKRENFVLEEKSKMGNSEELLDDVIINSIIEQAKDSEFTFEEDIN